jgi:curved DNA-binding protein
MDFKDYYTVLGVSKTATKDEIHKAFRKLARQYHPDVAKDKINADRLFKEINEAHEVLSDPEKRRQYDELQTGWKERQEAAGQSRENTSQTGWRNWSESQNKAGASGKSYKFDGTGFSDFFEEFFGSGGVYSRFDRRGQPADPYTFATTERARKFKGTTQRGFTVRGADVEGDIAVTLEEVFNGSVREVTMRRQRRSGVEDRDSFKVRIPPGVHEGQRLRVPGKGDPGMGEGESGDLFLNIRYALHPQFRVQDDDLVYEMELAPWEAILGTVVHVPTPDGGVSVRIPEGAHAGSQVRVRGRGLPHTDGSRGDLLLPVTIEVPERVCENERALWQKLAEVSNFNPRQG